MSRSTGIFIGFLALVVLGPAVAVLLADPSRHRFEAFKKGLLYGVLSVAAFVAFISLDERASLDNLGAYPYLKVVGFVLVVGLFRGLVAAAPEIDDNYAGPSKDEIISPDERTRLANERYAASRERDAHNQSEQDGTH